MPNQLSLSSRLALNAANSLARINGGFYVRRDIVFDREQQLKLDWYSSERCSSRCPLIIFFYGGGWMTGDKSQYMFAAQALTTRGYEVVIPNYRLFPQVEFPDFLTDAAKAVAFVEKQRNQDQAARREIFLMGHSAGGYIAAMIATDPQYLGQQKLGREVISAVAGIAGAYSFNPAETVYLPVFAKLQNAPESFTAMQIDTRVNGSQSPMLLLTGGKDVTVMQSNTDKLAAALRQAKSTVILKKYPHLNHAQLMSVFVKPFQHRAPVVEDIDVFFKQYLLR